MHTIKSVLVATLLSLFLSAGANAVTFDFRIEAPEVAGPVSYGPWDGISVTVTAFKDFGLTTQTQAVVEQSDRGIGVSGNPAGNEVGINEALQFGFTPGVNLLASLLFEVGTDDSQFNLLNSSLDVVHSFTVPGINTNGQVLIDLAGLSLSDTWFTIVGVDNGTTNGFDSGALIKEVTVTAAVPIPPALLLFATGLFGLGVLGRRRRKQLAA